MSLSISEWCYLFDIHAYVIRAFSCASRRVILLAAGLQELKDLSVKRLLVTSKASKPLAANCASEKAAPCRLRNLPGLGGRSISDDWYIIPWFLRLPSCNPKSCRATPKMAPLCNRASIAFIGLVLPEFWFRRGFSCGA